jgi:hypothetical protein
MPILDIFSKRQKRLKGDVPDMYVYEVLPSPFRVQHGIGYQYEARELVRVDSDLLHAEAVKPAIRLLRPPDMMGRSMNSWTLMSTIDTAATNRP